MRLKASPALKGLRGLFRTNEQSITFWDDPDAGSPLRIIWKLDLYIKNLGKSGWSVSRNSRWPPGWPVNRYDSTPVAIMATILD